MPYHTTTDSRYFSNIPSDHRSQGTDDRWQLSPVQAVQPAVVLPYFGGFFVLFFFLAVFQNVLRRRAEREEREAGRAWFDRLRA